VASFSYQIDDGPVILAATRIKPWKRVFWLGPEARQAVENGARLVGYEKYTATELFKLSPSKSEES